MRIVCGNAPYADGGRGRFLQSVVEDARRDQALLRYFCTAGRPNDDLGCVVDLSHYRWVTRGVLRWAGRGQRDFAAREIFDRCVARLLSRTPGISGAELCALDGTALHSLLEGRRLGAGLTVLEATTSHVANVDRQHRQARRHGVIEESWLTRSHQRKLRHEYEVTDIISVPSRYAWESFVEAGVPEAKLVRRVLQLPTRFAPPMKKAPSDVFTLIYVGRIEQAKGLVCLLDAFSQLGDRDLRLTLVGRFATKAMERFVAERRQRDRRIGVVAGDPLPHLHRADLFVHPSYEDSLAFGPLEALATGVPVVVTEDTGMKEYVRPDRNGVVVPTGDVDVLVDTLVSATEHPIAPAGIQSLLPVP